MSGAPPSASRRTLALVAAAVTALLAAAGCATGDSRTSATALPACSDVLVIGARGTGESLTRDDGLGSAVGDLYRRLSGYHPGVTVAAYGLPFAANTATDSVVDDASARLADTVENRRRQCSSERIVLAGYSLGAWITGDALQGHQLAGDPHAYTAAVLMADPRFNPADAWTDAGSFAAGFHGDRSPIRPPYPRAGAIRSYCRGHDPICQDGDPAADKNEHGRYSPTEVCQALAFIENSLHLPATDRERCLTDDPGTEKP